MNNSDYLEIKNNNVIEEFKGGIGAVGGGNFAGSGSFGSSRGSSSLSSTTNSIGGGKQYGSAGYASVSPVTGAMSGLANRQPGSNSGLGVIKGGAKTGTFTGGSFGGDGKYVVGFPGIKPGSNLPASSMPSMYVKPKPKEVKSTIATGPIIKPDVTNKYGHIDKHITKGIPGPRIGNYRDNVNHNHATKLRQPKISRRFDLKDKNLTGYYGYQGFGYGFDPFYWGYGPFWPVNGIYFDYPDIPYNYEDLMQKEINADYLVNTVQNQIADQLIEQETEEENNINNESETENEKDEDKNKEKKENFQNSEQKNCNKNTVIVIIATILAIYILFLLPYPSK
jgi:hypothetical protein